MLSRSYAGSYLILKHENIWSSTRIQNYGVVSIGLVNIVVKVSLMLGCDSSSEHKYPIYFITRVNPLTPSYKLNATTGVQFLHLDHYITKVKTCYRTTYNQWTAANEATLRLEEELDIESRWTVDSPQYQQALALMTERKYRKSIRLAGASCGTAAFRLTQLGMSGIGKLQ